MEYQIVNNEKFVISSLEQLNAQGTIDLEISSKADIIFLLKFWDLSNEFTDYKSFIKYLPKVKYKFKDETIVRNLQKWLIFGALKLNN